MDWGVTENYVGAASLMALVELSWSKSGDISYLMTSHAHKCGNEGVWQWYQCSCVTQTFRSGHPRHDDDHKWFNLTTRYRMLCSFLIGGSHLSLSMYFLENKHSRKSQWWLIITLHVLIYMLWCAISVTKTKCACVVIGGTREAGAFCVLLVFKEVHFSLA